MPSYFVVTSRFRDCEFPRNFWITDKRPGNELRETARLHIEHNAWRGYVNFARIDNRKDLENVLRMQYGILAKYRCCRDIRELLR